MQAAARAVTAALALVLTATSGEAVAAPAAPGRSATPNTGASLPLTAGKSTPDTAPDAPAGGVVILHTDSAAAAASGPLHDALESTGAVVRHTFSAQHAVSVQLPTDLPSDAASVQLAGLPGVARVEPAVTRTLAGDPNDPQLPAQRSYLDAVNARPAWARQTGSATVRVAVIDTGVDTGHPDLAGKVVGRYNAVTGSSSVTDTVGHGTFVAGVAAARTGNAVGIAGAGYNTSILAVKVADQYGDIAVDDEIAGIRWAADHGANVINLSLSGPDPSAGEQAAIRYAQGKGALVVAAAGNDGTAVRQYPAAYPGVVAVAATDVGKRRRAAFSSHGSWVTLAAPGVNLLSTTPRAGSDYFPTRSGYARGDGTSFASPLVAGAAALLKAQNPALTADQVRAALVASAHGYTGNDVGRGQVDFDLALRHVTPRGAPVTLPVLTSAGTVDLSALSTAPRVAFRVDDGPWLPTVPVVAGTARLPFDTYGYANGPHTVSARNCSEFVECGAAGTTTTFAVSNATPTLNPPSPDGRVSGRFTATGSASGGGLRLLVDGTEAAFDGSRDADGNYSFTANASLFADTAHDLTVQACTVTHARCEGPTSAATTVRFDSLHPTITGLSRAAISPNGDRSGDDATLTYSLPEAQDVTVETLDAHGTVVRTDSLGRVDAGSQSYRWLGLAGDGSRLPDGAYRLAVVTSLDQPYPARHGLAERAVRVDTVAPRLGGAGGGNVTFYPVRDGYRDSFSPTVSLPDGGTLRLIVRNGRGATVRTLQATRGPVARTALSWDGRNATRGLVAAGAYSWRFEAQDDAGNVSRTPSYRVTVSGKRLVTRTVSLTRHGATKSARGSAKCAGRTRSSYRHGVHLVNRCSGDSGEVGYSRYSFTVPTAMKYHRLQLRVYGRSARTSKLTASFQRTDGGLEIPKGVKVRRAKGRWLALPSVTATPYLRGRHVGVALVLGSEYRGTNDFDLRSVRLRVTVTQLV